MSLYFFLFRSLCVEITSKAEIIVEAKEKKNLKKERNKTNENILI